MLTAYQTEVNALIQAPSSPIPLVPTSQITSYINSARNQVATEGECIRQFCTLTFVANQGSYTLAAFVPPASLGLASAFTVRQGYFGGNLLDIRSWEWFGAYYLVSGAVGPPVHMAQEGQGSLATFYFSPIPTAPGTAVFDCTCLPVPLVDDTTIEAIPFPWTDAVPYWAAWLALQSLQRQADAEFMMQRYNVLMRRARDEASPSVLPENLPGDIGAKLAAAKTTLTQAQAPAGAGR
jgi:hypothetical protein